MKPRRVQICADDYGFDAAISRAILRCIDAGRLSATSCMVLSPAWPDWAPALRERDADLGLHLDLNEFAPYAPSRGLSGWIGATYLRQLDPRLLRNWIDAQLDAFEQALRREPDYVDGHQHVHQLPQVREALIERLVARYGKAVALRNTAARRWRGTKAAIIEALGSAALRRQASNAGIACNRDFAGVYGFEDQADFAASVSRWLADIEDGGLLMTHPGELAATETRADPIRAARARELEFWLSDAAGALLEAERIVLGRCRDWR